MGWHRINRSARSTFVTKKLHSQVARSLKDGGVLILEAYTERHLDMDGTGGPPQRDLFMSLDDLSVELEDLEFIIGTEVERNIFEGKYHQGESAVVQVVACKKGVTL